MQKMTYPVIVGGTEYHLVPNIQASQKIDDAFGGCGPLFEKLRGGHIGAMVDVVIIGSGMRRVTQAVRDELYQAVFDMGTDRGAFIAAIYEFVAVMARGGRPLDDDEDGDQKAEAGGKG